MRGVLVLRPGVAWWEFLMNCEQWVIKFLIHDMFGITALREVSAKPQIRPQKAGIRARFSWLLCGHGERQVVTQTSLSLAAASSTPSSLSSFSPSAPGRQGDASRLKRTTRQSILIAKKHTAQLSSGEVLLSLSSSAPTHT